MRTSTSLVRTLLAATAALGLASLSLAQSVTTAPVGAVNYSFAQGTQIVGLSMVRPAVVSGVISAVGSLSITSGSLNVGESLAAGTQYYLEVVKDDANSSLYAGDRYDIDTAATKSAAAGTIILRSTAENTLSTNVPSALVGASFVVRQHYTLGSLLTEMPNAFLTGDQITIRRDGTSTVTATLNSARTTWNAGLTNSNSVIIYPGVGFFLVRSSATPTSASLVGSVRTNNFVQVLRAGNQVLAEGFPVLSAPQPTSGPSRLFTNPAGATFSNGDRLTAYNPSGQLATYTYSTSTNRWTAGLVNGNVQNLFQPTRGVFLNSANANAEYVHVVPFTL